MSFFQNDQSFRCEITDRMIAEAVSSALRQEHFNITAAIKQVQRVTGIPADTVSKWYNGKYAPKSKHLLTLAAHYPQVFQAICELMEINPVWQEAVRGRVVENMRARLDTEREKWKKSSTKEDKFVLIRVQVDARIAMQLNQRQLWFLGQLQQGERMYLHELMVMWRVHLRTAKRDATGLVKAGLIRAVKKGRQCHYELL